MANVSEECKEAVYDVRDDATETNWCAFGYAAKTKITLHGTGAGGHEELMEHCTPDAVLYCLLRLLQGDRESQRVKFVFIVFVGENVGGMQRGRVGVHTGSVKPLVGVSCVPQRSDPCVAGLPGCLAAWLPGTVLGHVSPCWAALLA